MAEAEQPKQANTNTMAVLSFVLSLCGALLVLPVVGQILGIVFGFMGMNQIKETKEAGQGLALAGVLIGAISLVLGVLVILGIILIAFVAGSSEPNYY